MLRKLFQKVKELFSEKPESDKPPESYPRGEHPCYYDHDSQPIVIRENKVRKLSESILLFLPAALQELAVSNANTRLYILDKVSMKIYIMDVLLMMKMEQSKHPDDEFLVSTLKTLNYGYLSDQRRDIFTLITKENDRRIPYLLADSDWMIEVDSKVWWSELNITVPNLRHVRISGYEATDRVYHLPLNEWFKVHERPKYPEKREVVKPLFYSSPVVDIDNEYYSAKYDGESIQIILKDIELSKREKVERNSMLGELLSELRDKYPKDKIIITDENTGESYQVLKK